MKWGDISGGGLGICQTFLKYPAYIRRDLQISAPVSSEFSSVIGCIIVVVYLYLNLQRIIMMHDGRCLVGQVL